MLKKTLKISLVALVAMFTFNIAVGAQTKTDMVTFDGKEFSVQHPKIMLT